jgi:hypothetical protein
MLIYFISIYFYPFCQFCIFWLIYLIYTFKDNGADFFFMNNSDLIENKVKPSHTKSIQKGLNPFFYISKFSLIESERRL